MKEQILSHLPQAFPWRDNLLYLDSTDSTSNQAKQLALHGAAHGTVVIANTQSGGRGRMGRQFHSPPDAGIYLSLILRPQRPAAELMHLTCAAAVAMCDAIEAAVQLRPGIKWTNDLVCGRKKLGGILTELVYPACADPCAIIGIGINCNQETNDFPESIRQIATSLSSVTGRPVDRSRLVAAMLLSLEHTSNILFTEKAALMERYRKDCITIGREISLHRADSVRHGTAIGINEDGALQVIFSNGDEAFVSSGEVSIRGMYGYV